MVEIEKAVEISRQALGRLMPQFSSLDPQVSEFKLRQDDGNWVITFRAEKPAPPSAESEYDAFYQRYIEKEAVVAAHDGQLLSIRNPTF